MKRVSQSLDCREPHNQRRCSQRVLTSDRLREEGSALPGSGSWFNEGFHPGRSVTQMEAGLGVGWEVKQESEKQAAFLSQNSKFYPAFS